MEMVSSMDSLRKIANHLNLETDLNQKEIANSWCRSESHKRRKSLLERRPSTSSSPQDQETSNDPVGVVADPTVRRGSTLHSTSETFLTDRIDIEVKDMHFKYPTSQEHIFKNVTIRAAQGSLIAVIGPHNHGKATFLKLLANILAPQHGFVFVPSHLRVLHVSQSPALLSLSLWQNLTFGTTDPDAARVKEILSSLNLGYLQTVLDRELDLQTQGKLEDALEGSVPEWQKKLTATENALLHLGRALVMNPEVLAMQNPAIHFDDRTKKHIHTILRTFIKNRGIAVDASKIARRRPRTVIFTASSRIDLEVADMIWLVHDGGVKVVSADEAAEHDLWR